MWINRKRTYPNYNPKYLFTSWFKIRNSDSKIDTGTVSGFEILNTVWKKDLSGFKILNIDLKKQTILDIFITFAILNPFQIGPDAYGCIMRILTRLPEFWEFFVNFSKNFTLLEAWLGWFKNRVILKANEITEYR